MGFLGSWAYNGAGDLKKKITDLVRSSFPEVDFRLIFKVHVIFMIKMTLWVAILIIKIKSKKQ